jgi:uncharacterized protein
MSRRRFHSVSVAVASGAIALCIGCSVDAKLAPPPEIPKSELHEHQATSLDGFPASAHLEGSDADSFRRWFVYLSESQYFLSAPASDVNDCAALLRFAYRESLRKHDGSWATELGIERLPTMPDVARYSFPRTPTGANLFRTRGGPFTASDLSNGMFAEFADANTLRRFNTEFISRSIRDARDGDLLFYRQLDQRSPFHAMVYLEQSRFDGSREPLVVYHTGPIAKHAGEVRRPTLRELLDHPDPRWRPVRENPQFLGVYRWKILAGASHAH